MRRIAVVSFFAGLLALSPAAAASGHGAADQTLWKVANFAVLCAALGYLMYKKAGAFFRSRSAEIQKSIDESARLNREAEVRLAEAEARLRSLAAEVQKLRESASAELVSESERVRLETEQEIRKIHAQAEREIASAAKNARQELKAYSAKLAIALAEEKIRVALTREVDDSLVEFFVAGLDGRSKPQPAGPEAS